MALTMKQAEDAMERAALEAEKVTADALAKQAKQAIRSIQSDWPVLTGRSQAGWYSARTAKGATVANSVDYTTDVHGGLAGELVPRVLSSSESATVAEIEQQLTDTLEGR